MPSAIVKPHTATTHSSGPLPEGCTPTAINVSVMMPMVFCASLVPCESATRQAVTVWPWRNPLSTCAALIFFTMRNISLTATNAARPATMGDISAGTSTLATTAPKFTPSTPAPMMPPEMVLATSVERKAPIRLSVPAAITAVLGLRAPVAIDVAMALAVSWKPLVKSKISAVAMTSPTTMSVASSMDASIPFSTSMLEGRARSGHAMPILHKSN